MSAIIPVIDVSDTLAGRAGALARAARQVQDALTQIGFFVLTGHDVPPDLIARTFAEARRFHRLPMPAKLALKLNEHINGYMVMGRYAVRTSEINDNDKGDLNEAFFIKRERPPGDPLRRSGRRFVGPNQWPDEALLPGFRANVLEYAEVMDGFTRRFLPVVAAALDLPPDWFDDAFTDSQFTFRLSLPAGRGRAEPVRHRAAQRQQLHDLPGANRSPRPADPPSQQRLGRCAVCTELVRGQFQRHAAPLEQRPPVVDAAPRLAAHWPRPLRDPVLSRTALRPADRMPAELHRPRQPAALGPDHLRRLAGLLVRRQLRPEAPARRGLIRGELDARPR